MSDDVVCEGDVCTIPEKSKVIPKQGQAGQLPMTGMLNSIFTLWNDDCEPLDSKVAAEMLKDKVVGLYFSAKWCPPCRAFSPILSAFLQRNSDRFQVIYVPMDKSLDEMRENVRGKGFLCIPFEDQLLRQHMASKLNIMGIPSLIILDKRGERPYEEVVSRAGRTAVSQNPNCLDEWERGQCSAQASGAEQMSFPILIIALLQQLLPFLLLYGLYVYFFRATPAPIVTNVKGHVGEFDDHLE